LNASSFEPNSLASIAAAQRISDPAVLALCCPVSGGTTVIAVDVGPEGESHQTNVRAGTAVSKSNGDHPFLVEDGTRKRAIAYQQVR
jgi:hypothetical protein